MLLFNTLTRSLEPLQTLEPDHLKLYVCGVTVYDLSHVGHARVMAVFDTLTRHLRASGTRVTYVRNITDIDDKIIKRAAERGIGCQALTEETTAYFQQDMAAIGCLPPDVEPTATGHIDEMIALVQRLETRGLAYVGGGDVFFRVRKFQGYGSLSGKSLDDLQAGERIEVNPHKEDPLDFVLWKSAKPGEPQWDSPWGAGRPGWHLECSAMSMRYLGEVFDLHGGGMDLIFPHHENEIAQSCGASGHQHLANHWMHVGFLRINEEKMSKSLGNFFTIREVLAHYPAEALRLLLLSAHYHGPLDYSEGHMAQAAAGMERLYATLRRTGGVGAAAANPDPYRTNDAWTARFKAALDGDLNTAEAMAVLHGLAHEINKQLDAGQSPTAEVEALRRLGSILGLLQSDPESYLRGDADADEATWIEGLIQERNQARQERNWGRADEIRKLLADEGVVLEDGPGGTTWRKG